MPVYKFQVHTPLAPETAIARIQAITDKPESYWELVRKTWSRRNKQTRPFRGEVEVDSFNLELATSNPRRQGQLQIHGRIDPAASGSRMSVIMYLHPLGILIVGGLLSYASWLAWNTFSTSQSLSRPVFLFIAVVAITCLIFFPDAVEARRILETAVNSRSSDSQSRSEKSL